jgi:hypothetical protein
MDNDNSPTPGSAVKPDPKASGATIARLLAKVQDSDSPNAQNQLKGLSNLENRIGGQSQPSVFASQTDQTADKLRDSSIIDSAKNMLQSAEPYLKEAAKAGLYVVNPAAGRAVEIADKLGALDRKHDQTPAEEPGGPDDHDAPKPQ